MDNHIRQCKLCQMGVGIEEGLSQREIAKKYGIGKSSVGRHMAYLSDKGEHSGSVNASDLFLNSPVTTSSTEDKVVETEDEGTLEDLIRAQGDDPASVTITAKEVKTWEVGDGKVRTSLRVSYKPSSGPSEEPLDIASLFARTEAAKPSKAPVGREDRALVVVWADSQTGKVDRNGGTTELMARIKEKQERLREFSATVNAGSAFFLDAGDGVEGFENTGQQAHTNDLSLMEQVDLEATFEQETVILLSELHRRVEVTGIPSNHCAWRNGKNQLGKPSDDWGIFIKKQMKKALALNPDAFGHVNVTLPNIWEEFMTVDVMGHGVGLVHGHQVNQPEKMRDWWGKQLQGGNLWDAEILVHGHFHHLRIEQDGRHPKTKNQKYVIGAPALDNGSAWVGNSSGTDSDPGLLAFVVEKGKGFDFNSVVVL